MIVAGYLIGGLILAKRKGLRSKQSQAQTSAKPSAQTLDAQIEDLIQKKKYPQAIRKLQQGLKRDPNQPVNITEADILLLKGKDDFEQRHYKQAAHAFEQTLSLGLKGDAHYWLAKCWLHQDQPDKALTLLETAFDDKSLPKDFCGCYLKLLFITDQVDTVQQLIQTQAKRFYAPQLHWARGALAILGGEPEVALTHFKKMGRQASPEDTVTTWQAYAYQQAGNWKQASTELGMAQRRSSYNGNFGLFRPRLPQHPARQQLTLVQAIREKQDLSDLFDLREENNLPHWQEAVVSQLLYYIDQDDFHNAVHVLLDASKAALRDYSELSDLYHPLMLLAGRQAQQEDELNCTEDFWHRALRSSAFEPNLALHLHEVCAENGSYQADYKLLQQLVKWVNQAAKQSPNAWPTKRLKSTLAKLHCWQADSLIYVGRNREALHAMNEAEKLVSDHPEVLGRKGLQAFSSHQYEVAIPLLTQALEKGCQFEEVYDVLIEYFESEHDREALKSLRRKYGKRFGEMVNENEVEMPDWVECLTFNSFVIFEEFVSDRPNPSPALKMLQIFLSAAEDKSANSDKVTLNQAKAPKLWDQALRAQPYTEQVAMLQAICLAIQLYARKNKKGMTALLNRYLQQLLDLAPEAPEAAAAHLVLNVVKPPQGNRLQGYLANFLNRSSQPGHALAKVQLQARRFGPTRVLQSELEQFLKQDSQSPLLLLAKATCSANRNSVDYQRYYDQGFELARRLQDAEALQAFREEDWLKAQSLTRKVIGPNINAFMDPRKIDITSMVRKMAREMFGEEVPPEMLEQLIPLLQAKMMAELGNPFNSFEDDDDDDEFFDFFIPPGGNQKSGKKAKPWFEL